MENKKIIFIVLTLIIVSFLSSCVNIQDKFNEGSQLNNTNDTQNNNESVEENLISIKYQPKQCVKTPWQEWYEEGNIYFVKAPTEVELILTYYSIVYNITLYDIEEKHIDGPVCLACNVCPTQKYFIAKVKERDLDRMLELGWVLYEN